MFELQVLGEKGKEEKQARAIFCQSRAEAEILRSNLAAAVPGSCFPFWWELMHVLTDQSGSRGIPFTSSASDISQDFTRSRDFRNELHVQTLAILRNPQTLCEQ